MNLILECLYDDLVKACFLEEGPGEFKNFAVKFFQTNGFPLPSTRLAEILRLLAAGEVFLGGASLTGTFAYKAYYAGFFHLPPAFVHEDISGIHGNGVWDCDCLHLLCHESRLAKTTEALDRHMTKDDNSGWICHHAGIRIILKHGRQETAKGRLLEFLSRDQIPGVICHGHGIPVAVPEPARMAVYRLCVSVLRESEEKAAKDRFLASQLIPFLDRSYFIEMFEQLAEQEEMRPLLKNALHVADMPEDLREECMKLTGKARLAAPRSWKRKRMRESLLHKVACSP